MKLFMNNDTNPETEWDGRERKSKWGSLVSRSRERQTKQMLTSGNAPGDNPIVQRSTMRPLSAFKNKDYLACVDGKLSEVSSEARVRQNSEGDNERARKVFVNRESKSTTFYRSKTVDISQSKNPSLSKRFSKDLRSGSISSDCTDSSKQSGPSLQASPWDAFDKHVKNIDDSMEYYGKPQTLSFNSSDTFQKTMLDITGRADYNQQKRSKFSDIASMTNRFVHACRRTTIKDEAEVYLPSQKTVDNARRGWGVIRRYVNDMVAKRKGTAASLNWAVLTQTMKGLTDMERTRIDLYKRYGVIPTVNSDGSVIQENSMLSEKARVHAQMVALAKGLPPPSPTPPKRSYSHKATTWFQREVPEHTSTKSSRHFSRPKSSHIY